MGTWRRDLGVLATLTAASWVHPHSVWGNTIKLYPLIQPSHLSIVYCSSVYLTVRASPWIHYHTSRIFHISHLCAVIPWEVLLLWPTFQHLIPRPSFPAAFFFFFYQVSALYKDSLTTVRSARPQHLFYMHICLSIFKKSLLIFCGVYAHGFCVWLYSFMWVLVGGQKRV